MGSGVRGCSFLLSGLLLGCGLAPTFEAAGVGPLETPFAVDPPQAAALPAPPVLTPCPPGWVERAGEPVVCEPWPGDAPRSCAMDEAQFPGDAACGRIGTACPAGEWDDASAFPAGRPVLYVSVNGSDAGDGSRGAPFATLEQASAAAGPSSVIALGKGTHALDGVLSAGTLVLGACVSQTVVTRSASATKRVELYVKSAGVEIRNLRVAGSGVGLQVEGAQASAHVEDVVFDHTTGYAFSTVAGASATGRNVVIRSTQPLGTLAGHALEVAQGGTLNLSRVFIQDSQELGVHAVGAGTQVTLVDVAVLSTSPNALHEFGDGVNASDGAKVQLMRAIISHSANEAVTATGATLTLSDVVVTDTVPQSSNGLFGDGLAAHQAATLDATRVRIERSSHSGAVSAGATLTLTDAVVADTQPDGLNLALGVLANRAGALSVTRGVLARNRAVGASAADARSTLTLVDVDVLDTHSVPPTSTQVGAGGEGLGARGGASVTLSRVRLKGNHNYGIEVDGAALDASDLSVLDTGLDALDGTGGVGVAVFDGANVTLTRARLDANVDGAVNIQGASARLTVSDVSISHTGTDAVNAFGGGVVVLQGGLLTGTRLSIDASRTLGLAVSDPTSSVSLSQVTVRGTRARVCDGSQCFGETPMGVVALGGGALRLVQFLVTDNQGIGAVQAMGAGVDLSVGEVSFHQIGATVLDEGYDVQRLGDQVTYRFNDQNLSALSVPLPKVPVLTP